MYWNGKKTQTIHRGPALIEVCAQQKCVRQCQGPCDFIKEEANEKLTGKYGGKKGRKQGLWRIRERERARGLGGQITHSLVGCDQCGFNFHALRMKSKIPNTANRALYRLACLPL